MRDEIARLALKDHDVIEQLSNALYDLHSSIDIYNRDGKKEMARVRELAIAGIKILVNYIPNEANQ